MKAAEAGMWIVTRSIPISTGRRVINTRTKNCLPIWANYPVLGSTSDEVMEFEQLLAMFRNPDTPSVLNNLLGMSARLDIPLQALPKMLEDYADTFLSVANFQDLLDHLLPRIDIFLDELRQLQSMIELRQNKNFLREAKSLELSLEKIVAGISARFEAFYLQTNRLWGDVNAASFSRIHKMVTANQTIDASVRRRAQFLQEETRVGIEKVEALLNCISSDVI